MKNSMKWGVFSLFFSLSVLAVGQEAPEPYRLGLREAIALSLAQNFSVRIDRLVPEKANALVRRSKGVFDPTFSLTAGVSSDEVLDVEGSDRQKFASVRVDGTLPLGSQYSIELGGSDRDRLFLGRAAEANASATLRVTQPLLKNFGKTSNFATVRIADAGYEISKLELRSTIMRTVENTVRAFNEIYFAKQVMDIAIKNRDLAKQLMRDNARRLELGSVAESDMVVAETRYSLRKENVLIAVRQLRERENEMKQLVFDTAEDLLNLRVEVSPLGAPEPYSVDVRKDLDEALERRPDYQSSLLGIDINRLELERDRRQRLPGLDLVGSVDYSSRGSSIEGGIANLGDGAAESYSIYTVFSIPVQNRRDRSQYAASKINLEQAKLGLDQLKQIILLSLDDVARRVTSSWERISVTREARQLAERSLKAEEKKMNLGVSRSFFVLELQGDLANAQIRETRAITDYFNALALYELERGTILETYNIETR